MIISLQYCQDDGIISASVLNDVIQRATYFPLNSPEDPKSIEVGLAASGMSHNVDIRRQWRIYRIQSMNEINFSAYVGREGYCTCRVWQLLNSSLIGVSVSARRSSKSK